MTPTTLGEMFRRYPNAQHAISYVEMFVLVAPSPGEESAFQLLCSTSMSPREVVNTLRETIEDTEDPITTIAPEMRDTISREMTTADFVNYIAGLMGAM